MTPGLRFSLRVLTWFPASFGMRTRLQTLANQYVTTIHTLGLFSTGQKYAIYPFTFNLLIFLFLKNQGFKFRGGERWGGLNLPSQPAIKSISL